MRPKLGEKGSEGDARVLLMFLCVIIVTGGLPETTRTKCFLLMSLRRMCPCVQLELVATLRVIKLYFGKSSFFIVLCSRASAAAISRTSAFPRRVLCLPTGPVGLSAS